MSLWPILSKLKGLKVHKVKRVAADRERKTRKTRNKLAPIQVLVQAQTQALALAQAKALLLVKKLEKSGCKRLNQRRKTQNCRKSLHPQWKTTSNGTKASINQEIGHKMTDRKPHTSPNTTITTTTTTKTTITSTITTTTTITATVTVSATTKGNNASKNNQEDCGTPALTTPTTPESRTITDSYSRNKRKWRTINNLIIDMNVNINRPLIMYIP